jgi:hypothetical protein
MAWDNRKRIQLARGLNDKIQATDEIQVYGQPVYNKDKHYLTIGDGTATNKAVPIRVRTLQGWYGDVENINGGTAEDTFSLSTLSNKTKADQYIFTSDDSTTYISTGKPLYFYKPSATSYSQNTLMVLTNNATGTAYNDATSLGSDELKKETKFGLDIKVNTLIRGKLKLNTNQITTQANNFVTIPDSTDTLVNLIGPQWLNNKTVNGIKLVNSATDGKDRTVTTSTSYTLLDACAKNVTDRTSATAISSSGENLVTERSIYYGLPTINGSHAYTSSTTIYAPTAQLTTSTSKRYLVGASSTTSISTVNSNTSCYMQSGHLYSNGRQVINNYDTQDIGGAKTITSSLTIGSNAKLYV